MQNHWYFAMKNVMFTDANKTKLNENPIEVLKIWSYRPTTDQEEVEEEISPHVVKICQRKKKEKKKEKGFAPQEEARKGDFS